MNESPIQLGPISLQGFEIPSSVRFGGRQRLAVHRLSGGQRAVERLGPEDDDIAFQGTFSGSDAEGRVRMFDALRQSGEVIWLTWESFRRRVIVKSLTADYHSPWWITYRASCLVVNSAGASNTNTATPLSAITTDLTSAISAIAGSSISLTALQAALGGSSYLVPGTADQSQAAVAVQNSLASCDSEITSQSSALTSFAVTNSPTSGLGQLLAGSVSSAGRLAAAATARSYIGRIGSTLAGLG